MRIQQTEAIVLRRTNYGEVDRIVSLLTTNQGKISAIAKGVRRLKSKLTGGLELFATCHVSITEGKGSLGVVTSARLIHFYGNILHDYDRMQLGYECIKLVNRATETVVEADFYYLLRDSFIYLDKLDIDYKVIELWFRLQYMTLLGYTLNTLRTAQGELLAKNQQYNFDWTEMAFVAYEQGTFKADHIKLLRLAQAKNPAILSQISGIDTVLADCLGLVRTVEI